MDMIDVGPILVPDFPMKVWPFLPSWPDSAAEPQIETTYNTEVIRSRSGVEQRVAVRQWPSYRMRYERILWDEEYREAKAVLHEGKRQPWFFPNPAKSFRLPVPITQGSQYGLALAGWPDWVQAGRVLLLTDGLRWEAVFVTSRERNRFDTRVPFQNNWEAGAKVYAGLVGYFSDNTSLTKETDSVGRLTVQIDAPAVSNLPYYGLVAGGSYSPHAIIDIIATRLWPPAFTPDGVAVYPDISKQAAIIDLIATEEWIEDDG